MRLLIAARTDSSSSTMEMMAALGTGRPPAAVAITGRRARQNWAKSITDRRRPRPYERLGWLRHGVQPEAFGHPYKVGQGSCSHLPHDLPAMDLHRDLAEAELGGH